MQGELATLPVRELFGILVRTRATGRLSLSRGMAARRFHLREGRVLLASSSEEQTLLGRLLVERGLVGAAELHRVLAGRSRKARLGKVLAEEGLVTPAQLAGVLAEKVERLLVDSMSWRDGQFYFDDEDGPRREAAVASAVDLAGLLAGGPSRWPGRSEETVAVSDADVIEVRPLRPAERSGNRPVNDTRGKDAEGARRRRRGAA